MNKIINNYLHNNMIMNILISFLILNPNKKEHRQKNTNTIINKISS